MSYAKRMKFRCVALGSAVSAMLAAPGAVAQSKPADFELEKVEVIGTTPLPGVGVPLKDVASNVQVITSKDLRRQRAASLAEFLEANGNSINVNPAQNNPFQPDLNFRGFLASPLLGTPQGVSVFFDGVRINEPFGDVVNWDLVPKNAIASAQLNPGSNPAFGLNTLGGSLALYTKSGQSHPGASATLTGGSWRRRSMEFEVGKAFDKLDIFAAGTSFEERGWRQYSNSRVNQLFVKGGIEDDIVDLDVSVLAAKTSLQGTQALPLSWLNTRAEPYTYPDINKNQLTFVNAKASRYFGQDWLLSADVYSRNLKTSNFNSNVNDEILDDPDEENNALNELATTKTRGQGGAVQLSYLGKLGEFKNQFTFGLALDRSKSDFLQQGQEARFTSGRGVTTDETFETETDVETRTRNIAFYVSDNLSLNEYWSLSLAGRYNKARVEIRDKTGLEPKLNGVNDFKRFNPSAGLNFNPSPTLTLYSSYSEGIRVPSPVELTCASPEDPCKLPNNFLADPPLKPVIAKTVELGMRGKGEEALRWNVSLFRTELQDDIQFIAAGSGAPNAGFFQNVGKTRRQGLELGVGRSLGALAVSANYSYVDATYRSNFELLSVDNSEAEDDGDIQVRSGNRIPGVPRHNFKLRAQYGTEQWNVGVSTLTQSSQFARGDENNRDRNGQISGFTVVTLDGEYNLGGGWTLFAKVTNLFDKKYEALGTLGRNFFNGPGRSFDATLAAAEQFRGVAAPRGVFFGIEWRVEDVKGK